MVLKEKIQQDLKEALREKAELKSSVLRLLLAAVLNREKEKRYKLSKGKPKFSEEELEKGSVLEDEEVLEIISSEIKKRKEAVSEFEKGKREDLVKKEKAEIKILEKYLPEQLSEEEIRKLAKEVIEEIGVKEIKDIGKVMSKLMPKVRGRTEGAIVSKIVKELLIQNMNEKDTEMGVLE